MKEKLCRICQTIKPRDSFHKRSNSKIGIQSKCKDCAKSINKVRYENNKDRILELNCSWRENNKVKHRQAQRQWRKDNPEKVNFLTSCRRSKRKNATPGWANEERIKHIYAHCAWLNKTFGYNMQVDHVIPLGGKNVCGLHVHTNLQIIPAEENMKKSNTFLGGI